MKSRVGGLSKEKKKGGGEGGEVKTLCPSLLAGSYVVNVAGLCMASRKVHKGGVSKESQGVPLYPIL